MKDKQIFATVISKIYSGNLVDMTVNAPKAAGECQSGQFLHILCGKNTFLRRPISICDVNGENIRFIFEIKGDGTKALSEAEPDQSLDMLAPLGHGFEADGDSDVVLVGGGIGCFPLLYAAKMCGSNARAILGFRNKDAVYDKFIDDFSSVCPVTLMTDDGSAGIGGFTTDGLARLIASGMKISKILTCGPMVMMDRIIALAVENKIPCYASFEERMGCGIGTCLCCSAKVGEERLCVCKDGPVFRF